MPVKTDQLHTTEKYNKWKKESLQFEENKLSRANHIAFKSRLLKLLSILSLPNPNHHKP